MEQLSKEKSKLEDRWDSYEKNVALLCAQRKELEMERDAVLMEKVCCEHHFITMIYLYLLFPSIFSPNGDVTPGKPPEGANEISAE